MVNDAEAKVANCLMKKVMINGQPHLAIYAKRDLSTNEELRYDYGVKDLPWRIQKGINCTHYNCLFISSDSYTAPEKQT